MLVLLIITMVTLLTILVHHTHTHTHINTQKKNLSANPFSKSTVSDLKNWNYDNDDIKVFLEAKVTVSDCHNFLAV